MILGPTKVKLRLKSLWNLIEFGIPVEQVARWSVSYDTSNIKAAGFRGASQDHREFTSKTKILMPPQIGNKFLSFLFFSFLSFLGFCSILVVEDTIGL